MATIPRAVLDSVTRQVNALSADARARVLSVLEQVRWTPESVAQCREIVVEALATLLPTYTGAAAQAGADLYDAVRAAQVGETMGATAISGYDPAATEGAVRALVQQVVDGRPVEQFNRSVLDRVDFEVRRAENVSVAENAARDPLKPRYARVPSGSETCGFCIMLASRGFAYTSPGAASHAHASCDCRVIQGYPGMEVEGYDPDALYDAYQDARRTLGGRPTASEVGRELALRDPTWVRSGSPPEVGREAGAEPSPRELATAGRLASHGLRVTFRATRATEGLRTSDILVADVPWEIKQPRGSGRNNVYNQFNEARGQSDRLVIDASTSPFGFDGVVERAAEALSRRADFTEVIVVDDGSIRRIKKAR